MTVRITYNEYPLKYDSQTGSFTVGNTIAGATSGATATIRRIDRTGSTTGILYLESISGTFQNNEIIYKASYGSELVTNGDMELDSNWDDYGTPTTNERSSEQAHGGTYSRKFIGNEDADGIGSDAITVAAGGFYVYDSYSYISTLSADSIGVYIARTDTYAATSGISYNTTIGSWQQGTGIFQSATAEIKVVCIQSGAGAVTAYVDDVLVKEITNAALADGTVQNPINIDIDITRPGINPNFRQERSQDTSYSGKIQTINQYGIQEYSIEAIFSVANYYALLAWWSWARQGKLWAFTSDSTKTGNTTLDGSAASGQTTIPLTSTTGFSADDICLLKKADSDNEFEVITIDSVSAGVSVEATANLKFNYDANDVFRHLEYLPEVISLDTQFAPKRTGVSNTSGKYYKTTIRFSEAK